MQNGRFIVYLPNGHGWTFTVSLEQNLGGDTGADRRDQFLTGSLRCGEITLLNRVSVQDLKIERDNLGEMLVMCAGQQCDPTLLNNCAMQRH